MTIIKLKGGMGNQMFQYALGKKISILNNDPDLFLDISFYKKNKIKKNVKNLITFGKNLYKNGIKSAIRQQEVNKRSYSLNIFHLSDTIKIVKKSNFKKIEEINEFTFDKNILKCKGNFIYEGYFNTEKYFLDIKKYIQQDFTIKQKYLKNIKEEQRKIEKTNSISIHLRRGDYLSDKQANKTFFVCDLEYYTKAIKIMEEKVSNPYFFIFSDDIDWIKNNLQFKKNVEFISCKKSYEDFYLMSKCKHNIIANSTFSWWAAWLNKNDEKIIISPKKWLKNKDVLKTDLIPVNWIKI